ncbi:hypothetical protein RF679_11740 [Undibacterium cyanobacteriorum]|uniref:Uncharacterized protein n=1 Tax=Undibacterium cyanobacteriorum TaxID=3073561 RepID=A0ABY9RF93_9BURK|nr:hypothetical protein [Undibacterium sp. 20NA77.5]WMW79320.1 hypothetical protein RF679_11740 [Undibacterium sp. 20NA77.5]
MFSLYKSETHAPQYEDLLICYERDFNADNHEWREVVCRFLEMANEFGYKTIPDHVPPFEPYEDFVKMKYLVNGASVTFATDSLLGLIKVGTDSPDVLLPLWELIGDKVGWLDLGAAPSELAPTKKWWELWK